MTTLAKTIHPFPARMAPDLAMRAFKSLRANSIVLDPMAGSGTVLRHALEHGHRGVGFDIDPLAVLMTRVWTTPIDHDLVRDELHVVLERSATLDLRQHRLPWIDEDPETRAFIEYWFAPQQRKTLSRLFYVIWARARTRIGESRHAALDVLRIALSRIIITKEQGASLARDTSHSRPHRVADESDYDVLAGFNRSVQEVLRRMEDSPVRQPAQISIGDARNLQLRASSVDAVCTSPPYLNAIDYMRGHRMALVWMGYTVPQLRTIRAISIGSERAPSKDRKLTLDHVAHTLCDTKGISTRLCGIVHRYAEDLVNMGAEIARVLRPGGKATLIVGNSFVDGTFVRNASGVQDAAERAGLRYVDSEERELPEAHRYLPITIDGKLAQRMRTETILTLRKPKPRRHRRAS